MNKQTANAVSDKKSRLEDELVGEITSRQNEMETGKLIVHEENNWDITTTQGNEKLAIAVSKHARHPDRVLHQFDGVNVTTEDAKESWERAMLHEHARVEFDKEVYPDNDADDMMVNQLGIVKTADLNYRQSKQKMANIYVAGI